MQPPVVILHVYLFEFDKKNILEPMVNLLLLTIFNLVHTCGMQNDSQEDDLRKACEAGLCADIEAGTLLYLDGKTKYTKRIEKRTQKERFKYRHFNVVKGQIILLHTLAKKMLLLKGHIRTDEEKATKLLKYEVNLIHDLDFIRKEYKWLCKKLCRIKLSVFHSKKWNNFAQYVKRKRNDNYIRLLRLNNYKFTSIAEMKEYKQECQNTIKELTCMYERLNFRRDFLTAVQKDINLFIIKFYSSLIQECSDEMHNGFESN